MFPVDILQHGLQDLKTLSLDLSKVTFDLANLFARPLKPNLGVFKTCAGLHKTFVESQPLCQSHTEASTCYKK